MAKEEAAGDVDGTLAGVGPVAIEDDSTQEILKRLAELKEKEKNLKFEKDEMDHSLRDARQQLDGMKQDVEILNKLEPSQYQQLEREMQENAPAVNKEDSNH